MLFRSGEIRDKGRKKREKLINTFLPPMESVNQITKNNVRNLLHELSNWANEKGKVMKEKDENSLWIDQLSSVVSMSDAFTMLLDTESSNILNQRKMDSWLSCIYAKGSYPHVKAKQGCRLVVNSPSKILSVADKCVWMGLGNEETVNLECSFLYPSEKSQLALNGCITPWNEECERNYHELMNITPLLRTKKQLILVVCENSGGKSNQIGRASCRERVYGLV